MNLEFFSVHMLIEAESAIQNAILGGETLSIDSCQGKSDSVNGEPATFNQLPPKNDLVVWIRLSPLQQLIYEHFLSSNRVQEILNSTKSPLAALTIMKKVYIYKRIIEDFIFLLEI